MTTFKSSKGAILELKPVSQFKLDSLRASKKDIPIPTYQAKVAGGGTQEFPLDREIAEHKNRLPEWEAYVAASKALDADYSKKFFELLVWEGVELEVPDADSEWQKSSEYFGLAIPENPIERKLFYIYNEVFGIPEDLTNLITEIMTVSQMDAEAVAKLRASFRNQPPRKTHSRVRAPKKRLESQSDV
jgi:hypothetical protein